MLAIYGLKNCDTCRKALKWLDGQSISYRFHDVRSDGLEPAKISGWIKAAGLEALVNRRSTTWRNLDDSARAEAMGHAAKAFLATHATLIKRPVIEVEDQVLVGFNRSIEDLLRGQALK